MDAKPKRKNTPDTNRIEFVTTLSLDECVARLERGPTRTLDHRVNVRIDGTRFAVDTQIESGNVLMVVAELNGQLIPHQNNHTLVRANRVDRNPYSAPAYLARELLAVVLLGPMTGAFVGLILLQSWLWSIAISIIAWVVWYVLVSESNERRIRAFDQKVPDLNAWLRQHLDAPDFW